MSYASEAAEKALPCDENCTQFNPDAPHYKICPASNRAVVTAAIEAAELRAVTLEGDACATMVGHLIPIATPDAHGEVGASHKRIVKFAHAVIRALRARHPIETPQPVDTVSTDG